MPNQKAIDEINFSYTPFCDEQVVRLLIKNRLRIESASDIFDQDRIITYIDFDRLISKTKLSKSQKMVLDMMMTYGYYPQDIADAIGGSRQTYNKMFTRAIAKITAQAKQSWLEWIQEMPAKGFVY